MSFVVIPAQNNDGELLESHRQNFYSHSASNDPIFPCRFSCRFISFERILWFDASSYVFQGVQSFSALLGSDCVSLDVSFWLLAWWVEHARSEQNLKADISTASLKIEKPILPIVVDKVKYM